MTSLLQEAVTTLERLPVIEQDEIARVLLQLAGVEQEPFILTAEEHADLAEAEAEVARGELATDEEIRAMWARY